MGFRNGSVVKNSFPMQETQETWVRSLNGVDAPEKEMAPHPSILAWEIPWTEKPGGLRSTGCKESGTEHSNSRTSTNNLNVDGFKIEGRMRRGP